MSDHGPGILIQVGPKNIPMWKWYRDVFIVLEQKEAINQGTFQIQGGDPTLQPSGKSLLYA